MTLNLKTLHRNEDNEFCVEVAETGESVVIEEMFPIETWDCPEVFKFVGINGYEPMTAKELETEEQQDEKLRDPAYYIEEKFDGTRALVYFLNHIKICEDNPTACEDVAYCRVFSRRISKKTGFYVENTDSLPQIREIDVPELAGTILDGEMFIEGLPFKEVSSTLNCLWDKAIDRQIQKGFITFHAFDILFYKGIDLRKMPLERRKVYLHLAVEEANSEHIKEVHYHSCGSPVCVCDYEETHGHISDVYKKLKANGSLDSYPTFSKEAETGLSHDQVHLSPRAFYEYIVATGGEGLIVKPKNGKYLHKRGWEYSKIKKFLTREMIVIGFSEPTKEYTGKEVRKWGFWEEIETGKKVMGNFYGDKKYMPVTKHYYYNQVGNLLLGVLLTEEEVDSVPKNKRGYLYPTDCVNIYDRNELYVMEVCECAGFDDETREYFTRNKDNMVGTVVEVKANELFKDSGKLRHPRYMRQRFDKAPEECIWSDHIGNSEVTK